MNESLNKVFYSAGGVLIRTMQAEDIPLICKAEGDESKGSSEYLNRQLENQQAGNCMALIAFYDGEPAGYVFLYYRCKWGGLGNQGIPGIVDLHVYEAVRRKGIGSRLMDIAEKEASLYSDRLYLDVCLNSDYGAAQVLYAKRGYIPDGKGVYYNQEVCPIDAECRNDDELTLCLVKLLPEGNKSEQG